MITLANVIITIASVFDLIDENEMPRKPKPKPKRKKMDLIDRISGEIDRSRKINLHRWMGVQRLYAKGLFTRAEISAEFGIVGNVDEARQAGQLADQVDSFTGANAKLNKIEYLGVVEGVFMCLEDHSDHLYHTVDGTVDKVKVFTALQIVG